MAEYNGGVLVDENGNKYYPIASGLWCKEGNYGDQFAIAFNFGNTDDNNKMLFQGAVGASGEHPSLVNLMTLSGKSGNLWVKGVIQSGDVFNLYRTSGSALYKAIRTDTGVEIWMGVGSDGTNHGVYSRKLNKWILKADSSDVYLNGVNSNKFTPTSLYENSSGSNGTITLSQTSANFVYMDIFYNKGNYWHSVRIWSPNGRTASLIVGYKISDGDAQLQLPLISISGTSITRTSSGGVNFGNGPYINCFTGNEVKIYKVIGWK